VDAEANVAVAVTALAEASPATARIVRIFLLRMTLQEFRCGYAVAL
jgi:hypothetical protein